MPRYRVYGVHRTTAQEMAQEVDADSEEAAVKRAGVAMLIEKVLLLPPTPRGGATIPPPASPSQPDASTVPPPTQPAGWYATPSVPYATPAAPSPKRPLSPQTWMAIAAVTFAAIVLVYLVAGRKSRPTDAEQPALANAGAGNVEPTAVELSKQAVFEGLGANIFVRNETTASGEQVEIGEHTGRRIVTRLQSRGGRVAYAHFALILSPRSMEFLLSSRWPNASTPAEEAFVEEWSMLERFLDNIAPDWPSRRSWARDLLQPDSVATKVKTLPGRRIEASVTDATVKISVVPH